MEKKKFSLSIDILRIIMVVAGSVCSTAVLAFSILTIIDIDKGTIEHAPGYLFAIFIFLSIARLLTFVKDRTKLNLIRCLVLLAFDVGIGIVALFGKQNVYLFALTGGLYCATIVVSRIFKLIQHHKVKDIIWSVLLILFAIFAGIGLFSSTKPEDVSYVLVLECIFIAIASFVEVATVAFDQLKVKVLFKIIIHTYSLEIIFGLLTIMVAFSLVFMVYEPNITNFGDALWYSFAVVTTIGFGDYAAQTLVGRILTVILGIYGLLVVAILTSIIVNFYNETMGKNADKTAKEIQKEHDKEEKEKK